MCAHSVTCAHIVLHVLHVRFVWVTCVTCAHIVLHVQCRLCYMCGADCVTCAHIVLHVWSFVLRMQFVRCTLCYMLHVQFVRVTCVTCAICTVHIVLHVRTLCDTYGLRGSHVLRVRFYATHVLYHNELFGIVKISCYFSYKVKFDIKTFVGTH